MRRRLDARALHGPTGAPSDHFRRGQHVWRDPQLLAIATVAAMAKAAMWFTVPNDQSANFNNASLPFQGRLDKVDLDILVAGNNGTVVVSGCAATPHSSGSTLGVDLAAGIVRIGQAQIVFGGVTNLLPTSPTAGADPSNPRRDLITIDTSGVAHWIEGTAAAIPDLPNIPAGQIAVWAADLSAAATSITASNLTDKRVPQSFTPAFTISRLLITGDSRSAQPEYTQGSLPLAPSEAGVNSILGASSPMRGWGALVRDMCGVDPSVIKAIVPPISGAATDLTSPVGVLEVESYLAGCTYMPLAQLGGDGTNYRIYAAQQVRSPQTTIAAGSNGVNTSTFAGAGTLNVQSTYRMPASGTVIVATGTTPATVTYTGITATTLTGCTTTAGGGVMSTGGVVFGVTNQALFGSALTNGQHPGYETALYCLYDGANGNSTQTLVPGDPGQLLPPGTMLVWAVTHAGTGQADPGGVVTMRFYGRYANMAVGGARLSCSSSSTDKINGGWSSFAQYQPSVRLPAPQVQCKAAIVATNTTIQLDIIPELEDSMYSGTGYSTLVAGDTITFNGGTTVVVNGTYTPSKANTTITILSSPGAVAAGEIGVIKKGQATNALTFGYPQTNGATNGLVVDWTGVNDIGNAGVSGELTAHKEAARHKIATACCPYRQYGYTPATILTAGGDQTITRFNGTGANATWLWVTDTTPWCSRPQHLAAKGGTNVGSPATALIIKIPAWYDGVGAVDLFFASKQGQLGGKATITYGAAAAAGTALFSGTNSGYGIKVNGGNSVGTDDVIDTGFAAAITSQAASQGVGMVKRITGLPAGGGQIVITLTNMFSASAEFIFDYMGIEGANPSQPYIVVGQPYIPLNQASPNSGYSHAVSNANVDIWNTAIKAVIAERAESPANVVYLDINQVMNGGSGTADQTYWADDGLHLNDKGDSLLAAAVMLTAGLSFTPAQLGSR